MNYELAKKLKDAGFPNINEMTVLLTSNFKVVEPVMPTLSELIEACPKTIPNEYGTDGKFILWFYGGKWHAGHYRYGDENYVDCYPDNESGDTPEEAVANLWLKIDGVNKWNKEQKKI